MRINEAQKPTRKAIKYSMSIYPIWTDSTLEIGAAPEALSGTMFPADPKVSKYPRVTKPIRALELHYPMIQFLTKNYIEALTSK